MIELLPLEVGRWRWVVRLFNAAERLFDRCQRRVKMRFVVCLNLRKP